MKKKVLVMIAIFFALAVFAACGGGGGNVTPPAPPPDQVAPVDPDPEDDPPEVVSRDGDVTITVASRFGGDEPFQVFYRQLAEEFNALDNGITVDLNNVGGPETNYLDTLRVSFAAGEPPNVFKEHGGSRVRDYVDAGVLVDMTPYFEANPEWFDNFYYPGMFMELMYDDIDGIWGVPLAAYMITLYYNRELFEEVGVSVPVNFEELFEVSQAFVDADILPFQVGAMDVWRLGHFHTNVFLRSLGSDAMNRLATRELAYDSPEVIETFRVIEEMVSRGFLGQDILSNDYNTERAAFEAGQVAMRWDGTWYVSEIFDTPAYDFTGVAPFPWINEEHANAVQGGMSDGFFISSLNATDEQIEASVEFLEFLTSRENFGRFNEAATVLFPADFDVTPDTPDNPTFEQVVEIAASMHYMRPDLQNPDIETHMLDTVRNALQGLAMGHSAEETAEQIVAMQQIRE